MLIILFVVQPSVAHLCVVLFSAVVLVVPHKAFAGVSAWYDTLGTLLLVHQPCTASVFLTPCVGSPAGPAAADVLSVWGGGGCSPVLAVHVLWAQSQPKLGALP